jgi:antirestriction protein ArdC
MTNTQKFDVQQSITDRLIAMIEAGAGDFMMPWHRSTAPLFRPKNALTGKHYRGVNIVSLWMTSEQRGYSSNQWGTFKQWLERDAAVKKGEKGTPVVIYKEYDAEPDPKNPDDNGRRMFARASWVFNASQVDGYSDEAIPAAPNHGPIERLTAADVFIAATGARLEHGGSRAFYRPATDHIQMPDEGLFIDTATQTRSEGYYSTALHELTHWSGAAHRLNREKGGRFGDPKYAFEELVAELGAAFLCGSLGISNEPRADHAQYLQNWLAVLKHDKRALVSAASQASKAADYLEDLAAAEAKPVEIAQPMTFDGWDFVKPTSIAPEPSTADRIAARQRKLADKSKSALPADHGLFGSSALQLDLVDQVRT